MSYQVFVRGDGESFWTGHDDLEEAFERFQVECNSTRQVSLVWEGFDYEPE